MKSIKVEKNGHLFHLLLHLFKTMTCCANTHVKRRRSALRQMLFYGMLKITWIPYLKSYSLSWELKALKLSHRWEKEKENKSIKVFGHIYLHLIQNHQRAVDSRHSFIGWGCRKQNMVTTVCKDTSWMYSCCRWFLLRQYISNNSLVTAHILAEISRKKN